MMIDNQLTVDQSYLKVKSFIYFTNISGKKAEKIHALYTCGEKHESTFQPMTAVDFVIKS